MVKVLVTCRFPEWGNDGDKKYPAFGVKYVIEVPIECEDVAAVFQEKYKERIKQDFNGEILFIEEFDCTILI
ncbi:hypothetical protein CVU83_01720 [Candidatus Falkowbacteria bacterium HGW-Falkowbacteria-2]|uniref:Uncharacterized protein n=1 Tax=Candidatus Falkowbacteria bacterium HGW-Falkowbacteria-2 TaxID=2013769 RepID=A0A2N2E0Z4_9BACT|nr:MAG: hypothetical protein CVU83_01720 [Candidatus Falkowbacteria bacterium HGW-Falkowbacteria-2]